MLELFELLKMRGEITTQVQFCEAVEINPPIFNNIKNNTGRPMHFTPEHIENACKCWNVDANWVFGFSSEPFKSNIKSNIKRITPAKHHQ